MGNRKLDNVLPFFLLSQFALPFFPLPLFHTLIFLLPGFSTLLFFVAAFSGCPIFRLPFLPLPLYFSSPFYRFRFRRESHDSISWFLATMLRRLIKCCVRRKFTSCTVCIAYREWQLRDGRTSYWYRHRSDHMHCSCNQCFCHQILQVRAVWYSTGTVHASSSLHNGSITKRSIFSYIGNCILDT